MTILEILYLYFNIDLICASIIFLCYIKAEQTPDLFDTVLILLTAPFLLLFFIIILLYYYIVFERR